MGDFYQVCSCGAPNTPRNMIPAKIDGHPPIGGIPAHQLIEMRFVDAVKHLPTQSDLVQFGKLRKMDHPVRWARQVMEQRLKKEAGQRSVNRP